MVTRKKNGMEATAIQKQLIEEIGVVNENNLGLSPLAARIYALLITSSYEGLTFEEIREFIGASKSSVSVNLNVLTQLKYIEYYTKSGDRKRYFKVAKYFQIQALIRHRDTLDTQIKLLVKINAFNKTNHPEKFRDEKSFGVLMQDYLKEYQKLIDTTINGMSSFRLAE